MQKVLRQAAGDLGLEEGKTIKLECNDQYGYFFRVTIKEEQALRRNKQYDILNVAKGGVRFRNNKLTNLNEEYSEVKSNYEHHQKTVVSEVLEVAGKKQKNCAVMTFSLSFKHIDKHYWSGRP